MSLITYLRTSFKLIKDIIPGNCVGNTVFVWKNKVRKKPPKWEAKNLATRYFRR